MFKIVKDFELNDEGLNNLLHEAFIGIADYQTIEPALSLNDGPEGIMYRVYIQKMTHIAKVFERDYLNLRGILNG